MNRRPATWVGRPIRRFEDPALVTGRGRFTADLAGRAPRALRAQPGGLRPHQADRRAGRSEHDHRGRSERREADPPDAAQVQLHAGGAAGACRRGGALRRRTGRGNRRRQRGGSGGSRRARRGRDRADRARSSMPARAIGGARHSRRGAGQRGGRGARARPRSSRRRAAAPHRLVTVEVRSRRQNAMPMETRAAHAAFDPASGRVTLTCSTQMPHLIRTAIADLIGMPEIGSARDRARCRRRLRAENVAGARIRGAGAGSPARLRTSVAWSEDRRENLIACFHSRDQHVTLEGAFDADGKLVALSADVLANIGAYSCFPTTCGVEPLMAMAEMPGPYDVREYACVARGVVTNTCPMAPYRGVSRPVITFTLERLMDKAAAEFGLDPIEIRRRNLIQTFPYTSATGLVFDEASYVETMEMAVAAIDRSGVSRAPAAGARARAAFSASALRPSPNAPATARRHLPPAAWRSRPAGRPSR